MQNFNFVSMKP